MEKPKDTVLWFVGSLKSDPMGFKDVIFMRLCKCGVYFFTSGIGTRRECKLCRDAAYLTWN